jgi:undecaprenyl-diphosphatase
VVFVVVLMTGELAAFLTAAAVVKRPRPAGVSQLDHGLPTSAFPSGHEAATCCLYIGLAILVIGHARGWWRWLFLIPAVAMPVLVALSRMYRGEHLPTDIVGSLVFSGLWLTAAVLLIRPNEDRPDGSAGRMAGTEGRGAAGRRADTAPRPEGRISRTRTTAARARRAERTP